MSEHKKDDDVLVKAKICESTKYDLHSMIKLRTDEPCEGYIVIPTEDIVSIRDNLLMPPGIIEKHIKLFKDILDYMLKEHLELEAERGGKGTLNFTDEQKRLTMQLELQIANCEYESSRQYYKDPTSKSDSEQIELLNKQYEALLDRFDVAMQALDHIANLDTMSASACSTIAQEAIDEVNQMIRDYDNKIK